MSNKTLPFLILLFIIPVLSGLRAAPEEFEKAIQTGDQLFDEGRYSEALEEYAFVYSAGYHSRIMLYRMAYIHDNAREYPEAIYYLKKLNQEYGGKNVNEKIIQLFQKNGSYSYRTEDFWSALLRFYNKWSWLLVGIGLMGVAAVLAWWFLKDKLPVLLQKTLLIGGLVLSLSVTIFFGIRSFAVPERAVILADTSFYAFPSFGAESEEDIFNRGETVRVKESADIWIRIQAGKDQFWVPEYVIRRL